MPNNVPRGSPILELGKPHPLPGLHVEPSRTESQAGMGFGPWMQARSSERAHLCGKCSLFISELQLVKFYSDKKLVTSLSNY